jgi:hypothetical protein
MKNNFAMTHAWLGMTEFTRSFFVASLLAWLLALWHAETHKAACHAQLCLLFNHHI